MVKIKINSEEVEEIAKSAVKSGSKTDARAAVNWKAVEDLSSGRVRPRGLSESVEDSLIPAKEVDMSTTTEAFKHDTDLGIVPEVMSRTGHRSEEGQEALVNAKRISDKQTNEGLNNLNKLLDQATPQDIEDYRLLSIMGSERKEWLIDKPEYLDEIGVSEMTKKLLRQEKIDSDAKWLTDVDLDHKTLKSQGYMSDINGWIVKPESLQNVEYAKNFDKMSIRAEDGSLLNYRNISAEQLKEQYFDEGYQLIRIHPREVAANGLDFTHYLTKDETVLKPLTQYTLPYLPGLSRAYTPDTHFVKIGRAMYSADGLTFNGYPKTLIAGSIEDYQRLQTYAEDVNKVIEAYNRAEGNIVNLQRELDTLELSEFKPSSAQDVMTLIRSENNPTGLLDPNYRAQVLSNKERLSYNNGLANLEKLDYFDRSMSDLMERRGQFYRGRGDEILENINGGYTHVVDPLEMWRKNIEDAVFNNNYGEMLQDWGEYFKRTYADVLKFEDWQNINRMSGAEAIATAHIEAPNDALRDVATAARRCQMSYKNILNIPTRMDTAINKGITNAVKGLLPNSWWNTRAVQKLMNSSPISFANAVVFRTYLGCFNIAQLFKQGPGAMINTFALDPVNGARALVSMPAVLMGHFFKDTPVVKYIPKLLAGLGGISPQQYEGFLKFMDQYGTFSQMANRPELAQECSKFLATAKGWQNADLVFLNMGNNLGQLYADLTAFIKQGGTDFKAVARYSDDLLLNINRINTSTFQRSTVGKLVGQFTSYPISALEVMTNKRLTGAQRARFMLAQLGLWGLAGTFGKDYATNIYNAFGITGEDDPEMMRYVVDGWATSYFAELGIDVREGIDVAGLFNQVSGMIPALNEMFGASPDLPISNVGSIFGSMYSLAKDAIDPDVNTWDTLHWARRVASDSNLPSGMKNLSKAYIAFDAKQYWDKNGDILRRDVKTRDAFYTLMGFGPIENMIKQRVYKENQLIKGTINDYFEKHVQPYVDRLNTYKRTGYGKTEIPHNRDAEWGQLLNDYRRSVRDFQAYVHEFHKEYRSYATDLIHRSLYAGKDFKKGYTNTLKVIYDHNENIQGVRQ